MAGAASESGDSNVSGVSGVAGASGVASTTDLTAEARNALAERLAAYCASRMPAAREVRVSELSRIFGGASRETWRFQLDYTLDGAGQSDRLILRRDPGASLIDTERRIEYGAYEAFADSDVPVPRMLWLEERAEPLDHPFFIMREVGGCEAGPLRLMQAPYRLQHARIAEQKWSILGRIARFEVSRLQALLPAVTPQAAHLRELDHWAAIIEREALEPQPVMAAAIRWLRRNPPPPAQRIVVVHGDFRTGNFLVSPDGEIKAILDWEMMHLGDPLEDLAWGLNRTWAFQPGLVGGLARREDALRWWRAASGLHADPAGLHWWELLSCVKGQAIWLSAARAFQSGANRDLIMAVAAIAMGNTQDRAALELMGKLA